MQDDPEALNKWEIFFTRVTDSYIEIDGKFKWALFLKTWIITFLLRCYNEACSVQTLLSHYTNVTFMYHRAVVIHLFFIYSRSLFTSLEFCIHYYNFHCIGCFQGEEIHFSFAVLLSALLTKKAISFIHVWKRLHKRSCILRNTKVWCSIYNRLQVRQVWFYYYFNIVIIFYFSPFLIIDTYIFNTYFFKSCRI